MNRILSLLAIARRRMCVDAALDRAILVAAILAGVALVAVLVTRGVPALVIPWVWVSGVAVLVLLVASALAFRAARRSDLEAALLIDERLGLKERFATAVSCAGRDDPFALAAVEDAVTLSADASLGRRVRRAFPVTAPGSWWIAPLLVALALGATFLPQRDLFASTPESREDLELVREEVRQSIEEVAKNIKQDPALESQFADMLAEMQNEALANENLQTPEDIRREAIKQVTELTQRLDEVLNGQEAMVDQALREAMKSLDTPKSGPAKEIAEAMAKGDFKQAREALKQMVENAQNGNMPPEQAKELAQQLEQLAKQLEQLAGQQKMLEDALRKAGLDPALANNPAALQQQLQQAQNLNEQQRQQLQQMAQAQQQACQMCQNMAQAMGQMGQAMQGGDGQQMAQAGMQADQMLNQAEMLRQMMMQAQAAMQACQGQCQGLGQGLAQLPGQQGGAFGGRGQGAGGNAPITPTPFGTKLEKENAENVGGEVIARQLVDGASVTGESRVRLEQVASEIAKGHEATTAEDRTPPHLQQVHKYYFGQLEKRIRKATEEEQEGEKGSQ